MIKMITLKEESIRSEEILSLTQELITGKGHIEIFEKYKNCSSDTR